MISEYEQFEYESGATTLIGSFVCNYFHKYFLWRCRRKYKRYLGFKEYQRLQKEKHDRMMEMMIKVQR